MLFIVRTQTGMIMSQDFTWRDIKQLTQEDKYNLLTFPSRTAYAKNLHKWFISGKEAVSPVTPKKIYTKWGVDLSMVNGNTFAGMIQLGRCPEYLKRAPEDKKQIAAFQKEWVKESSPVLAGDTKTNEPIIKSEPEPSSDSRPARQLNFLPTAIPVKKRSDLINKLVSTFSDLEELRLKVPEILKEKQTELGITDKKLLDLRHIIELGDNLNAAEGYRCYRMQREALRRRRTLKDEIIALDAVSDIFAGSFDSEKISNFIKSIDGLDDRQYRPRAILESEVGAIIQNPKILDSILGN